MLKKSVNLGLVHFEMCCFQVVCWLLFGGKIRMWLKFPEINLTSYINSPVRSTKSANFISLVIMCWTGATVGTWGKYFCNTDRPGNSSPVELPLPGSEVELDWDEDTCPFVMPLHWKNTKFYVKSKLIKSLWQKIPHCIVKSGKM